MMMDTKVATFLQSMRTRLTAKGYVEQIPVAPLQMAFFKHGALNLPYAVAFKDATISTDSPKVIYQHVKPWFDSLIGHTGSGALLLIYSQPTITTVEEAQGISGQVVVGVHDIFTGKHWLSNYMGWEQELYG
jgi:hypothetical protein